ncbi:hypothetical protein ACOSQ2_024459 [Xanthoceras sorbifolium]
MLCVVILFFFFFDIEIWGFLSLGVVYEPVSIMVFVFGFLGIDRFGDLIEFLCIVYVIPHTSAGINPFFFLSDILFSVFVFCDCSLLRRFGCIVEIKCKCWCKNFTCLVG